MNSDKEFYLSLFPEDGPATCKYENCASKAVRFSIACAKHHFEMVMKKPCPFTYEDVELYKKGAHGRVGWELFINSITNSTCNVGGYIAFVLFGVLFNMFLTWSGYPRDAWLEGDWVTSGILGGIMVSLFIICNILYQILFTKARRRRLTGFSSGWASMIISIGLAGMGIGWLIATKIQWPQLTAVRNIPLTNIFGTLVGLIIGLSIGLGTHKAFMRVS